MTPRVSAKRATQLTVCGVVFAGLLSGRAQGQDAGVTDAGAAAAAETKAPDVPKSSASLGGATLASVAGPSVGDAAKAEPEPWGELPAFLNTADKRIRDERPPPTPEQVEALSEMEREVARFRQTGEAFNGTALGIVRREYLRQRRQTTQRYAGQIREAEAHQDAATQQAIAVFERFVQDYPNDPKYTPDAMFRLGELYFERSAIAFQNGMIEVMAAREAGGDPPEPEKDFAPTIDIYRDLITRFPNYTRIDGVYYLIGYCLGEMGQPDRARLAWLNLVCSNQFDFRASMAAVSNEELATQAEREKENPALNLAAAETIDRDGPMPDVYGTCTPAVASSRFISETWLRIGEYHFDYDVSNTGMASAISAYKHVLVDPTDRNYNLALYKVAWSYYRSFRYPEAIQQFAALVEWSDEEQKKTGKAGSELRSEAVQYLAIAFAYDDWNENQVPDPQEGQATGITRVQNSNLMRQDRDWTAEVYHSLGGVFFDEAKYAQAIEVWNLSLKRWPNHPKAPEMQYNIARAYTRANEQEAAVKARALLANYSEGSAWWNSNLDHPIEQRRAEQLAEEAMVNAAIYHHQNAQRLRRLGVQDRDPELIRQAQEQYGLAAKAYRSYIQRYPNSPQAYELQYNLADALFWSESYEEAAREYSAVRDSNLDDRFLSESARRVVESLKRLVDTAVERGEFVLRTEPPAPSGQPPRVVPVPMPPLVQRLAQAREMYVARVDEVHDTEHVRASYAYNNAVLLYQYGYWAHGRERFLAIYEVHCNGPRADETGRVAWLNLRNIAVTLGEVAEVERLGTDLRTKGCTFAAAGKPSGNVDCKDPKKASEPECLAVADLTNIQYKKAVDVFAQAEKAKGKEQVALYEESATLLIQAVDAEPNHPQAPLALEKAAIALERTSRYESAARLYSRIIDEVGAREAKDAEDQQRLDAILASAYFRLAFNANRFFDYDRAVENYKILADSERFKKSTAKDMTERREGALINAAKILEYQQQYARAAGYYQRAAESLKVPAESMAAYYRVAEMSYKQQKWPETVTAMNGFINRYRTDPAAGELVVQAHWRIAQARKAQAKPRDYAVALAGVAAAYDRSGQQPGSMAAEYAAQSKFLLVDKGVDEFESFAIKAGKPPTLKSYVDGVKGQIEKGALEAKQRNESYDAILAYRRPTWTIAAFARQGRIYEILAKAILDTPFVVPDDMKKKMAKLPEDAREEVRIQVEDTIRQLLDQQVRPIECFAVVRYALAARAARIGSIDNEYTQQAITRLGAYGDERIGQCIAEQQAKDSSLGAYKTGEFSRAPRGETLPMPVGVSPPPLRQGGR